MYDCTVFYDSLGDDYAIRYIVVWFMVWYVDVVVLDSVVYYGMIYYGIIWNQWFGTLFYGVLLHGMIGYKGMLYNVISLSTIILPHPFSSLPSPQSSTPLHFKLMGRHFLMVRQLNLLLSWHRGLICIRMPDENLTYLLNKISLLVYKRNTS